MRRFSQRNSLVTLSDINITPLLDLAFVLLIIFVITTPLLEQSLKLELPSGGRENSKVKKEDVRTVELTANGQYMLKGRSYTLAQIEPLLVSEFKANPNLALYIRAGKKEFYENVIALVDMCQRNDITRFHLGTAVPKK